MLVRKVLRTAILCAIIIPMSVAADFFVTVVLNPGHGVFTPWNTLAIATAVTIPSCYYLVSQRANAQAAYAALANSLEARDSAEAASQAKSEFLANVSHELRTPLNAVINYSEIMLEGAVAAKRAGDVADHQRVLRAAGHLLSLIDDLLDYAEADSGLMDVAVQTFDPAVIARDAASFAEAEIARRDNTFDVDIAKDFTHARNDPVMLTRCLLHLLTNAAKFTQAGRVRLRARRQRADGAEWLVFQVADSGIGIAPEDQARIFAPLTQLDGSASRAQGGTGMGLAMTRRMAALMGGEVSLVSAPGKGSVFTLRVPAIYRPAKGEGAQLAA